MNSDSATTPSKAVYFAYGTLLDVNHMRNFCTSAQTLGVMRFKGYRLGFAYCGSNPGTGGCTLVEDKDNTIYGMLYEMPAEEKANLDSAGVDHGWSVKQITVLNDRDEEVPANTHYIADPSGPQSPSDDYVRPILTGARNLDLPAAYITQLEDIITSAQKSEDLK